MSEQTFRKVNLITILAVYFLILVGGIVRSMGAGMGCPDWPRCFGRMIPPTSVQALPEDYKEYYLTKRLEKNQRLAGTLSVLGMDSMSERVLNDPLIRVEEDFSPVKAWVEYFNRIVGVIIGICIIATVITSLTFRKSRPTIVGIAILSLVLVIFQGWIGSLVVSTNLLPGFVSFHMVLALVLVALLLYSYHLAAGNEAFTDTKIRFMVIGLLVLSLPQIFLGTQIREEIDVLKAAGTVRSEWISNLEWIFYVHRSYSLVILGLALALVFRITKLGKLNSVTGKLSTSVLALIILLALSGAIMTYFNVPAIVQPLHLVMGSGLFGLLFYLVLQTERSNVPA